MFKKIKEKKALKKKEEDKKKTEKQKLEERREEVLAAGRKFKYPLQYAKHRVVALTVLIVLLALAAVSTFTYISLYKMQSTNEILYRLTTVLPVSAAKVDGERVRFSDYLLIYKSTITPVQAQDQVGLGDDAESLIAYYKRMALSEAEEYTYALKLARENNISVSEDEISAEIVRQRNVGGVERSEESFEKILSDNFGVSMREYRRMVKLALTKQKVQAAIDSHAKNIVEDVQKRIDGGGTDLQAIASSLQGEVVYEETGGLVDAMNVDGGRAAAAMKLEPDQISKPFLSASGDGYYFVKLVGKTESTVNYVSLEVKFTEFDKRMAEIREQGKVAERIELADTTDLDGSSAGNTEPTE